MTTRASRNRARKRKRSRKSSSDTEEWITIGRDKHDSMENEDNADGMESVPESTDGANNESSVADTDTMGDGQTSYIGENETDGEGGREVIVTKGLNEKLNSIITGQTTLRDDINANFVKLSKSLADMIDSKLAGLRAEIDGKLEAITLDLRDVQARVSAMENRDESAAGTTGVPLDPADAGDLRSLRQKLDRMEASGGATSRLSLIVKGLQEAAGEGAADLTAKCERLLSQLHITAPVTAARRLGVEGRGRTPRPVSLTVPSQDVVREIMREKRKLKDTEAYSSVYIEPDRPHEIRAMEANIRRLARDNPALEMVRGRLVDKNRTHPHNAEGRPPVPPQ